MFLFLILILVGNLGVVLKAMLLCSHSTYFIKGEEGFTKSIRPWGGGLKSNVRTLFMQEKGKTTGL
jgi:hypothetical protein